MSKLEQEILEVLKIVAPHELYVAGFEEQGDNVPVLGGEKIDAVLLRISKLKKESEGKNSLAYKFLDSLECKLRLDEPGPDAGMITEVIVPHLVKEGFNLPRLGKIVDLLADSIDDSLRKFEGRNFPLGVLLLAQYQILGAMGILDTLVREGKSAPWFLDKVRNLRNKVEAFKNRFAVEGFIDGQFEEVEGLMAKLDSELGREKFYPYALRSGFDYAESPKELERKAISWIDEDLPKFRRASKVLAKELQCDSDPESIKNALGRSSGVGAKEALSATIKMRPIIRAFVVEQIVAMNEKYDCIVVETPPYLTATIPSAAAQGYDMLTDSPITRYYLTTDERRAPPSGFADLANTLVHEEYGHCLHFSNTATHFAANPTFVEVVNSLHSGPTSEGLAFQRELEFLDALHRLDKKKKPAGYSKAEKDFVNLANEYGGLHYVIKELEFETYRQRLIRFLRVVGDSRINSGRQDLLSFLRWAEKKTGLSRRTIYYQIFPAHEAIFPGYATCYAVVGQEIRAIQKPFRNDASKLRKFNAYACSMGFPARSIYIRRLKELGRKIRRVPEKGKRRQKNL